MLDFRLVRKLVFLYLNVNIPEGNKKRLQGITRGYKGLRAVAGGYQGLQEVKKGYKGLQGVTRD